MLKDFNSDLTVESTKLSTDLTYSFEGNTSSILLVVPTEDYHDPRPLMVLKVIEEADLPYFLMLKELVGMALGIADLE